MILVNGEWETVNTIEDVIAIIQEQIGNEFADRVKDILEENYARKETRK